MFFELVARGTTHVNRYHPFTTPRALLAAARVSHPLTGPSRPSDPLARVQGCRRAVFEKRCGAAGSRKKAGWAGLNALSCRIHPGENANVNTRIQKRGSPGTACRQLFAASELCGAEDCTTSCTSNSDTNGPIGQCRSRSETSTPQAPGPLLSASGSSANGLRTAACRFYRETAAFRLQHAGVAKDLVRAVRCESQNDDANFRALEPSVPWHPFLADVPLSIIVLFMCIKAECTHPRLVRRPLFVVIRI